MKQYPNSCYSSNCGEIYCKGCKYEKHLIAYYGEAKHAENQFNAAWTLAKEVNSALSEDRYKNDWYYLQLAGRKTAL